MPHRCVHCGELYPDAAPELLKGCSCGSRFFFFLREMPKKDENKIEEFGFEEIEELKPEEKKEIEKDIRDIIGIKGDTTPVILDLESVKVLKPGKFEIDIVNLFSRSRPIIYKLEEGKYIIDLASTLRINLDKIRKR